MALCIFIKFIGTISELMLPYILEHMIDHVVPAGHMGPVIFWGLLMFLAALLCRQLNVMANNRAIGNARKVSYHMRQDLFEKTLRLSGRQFDEFGLPSLISRMSSDSYNVQAGAAQIQSLCVRSPIMLLGGLTVTLMMDAHLAMILVLMLPVLILIVLLISARGIPLYTSVQKRLDTVVRIMRENITGIRVVKALNREDYETDRFEKANRKMTDQDITAATIMAVPGPFLQMCLNAGLAIVVLVGAHRVDAGQMKPGVILAFLTYFNMISMGVMALSRIFMTLSRASASASRIDEVLRVPESRDVYELPAEANASEHSPLVCFSHVSFSYNGNTPTQPSTDFAGEAREMALTDISFSLHRGESLGIIGPTGSGKSTIVQLLMRFYETENGSIYYDGQNVRTMERSALRSHFAVVFQNDMIFHDTLRENISFGRELDEAVITGAVEDAMAADFIRQMPRQLDSMAGIRGANLSGGQKQRLLVARALAGQADVLILDDSSSALDYRTDAQMRQAIMAHHTGQTLILIAQRVSSVMGMSRILVLDDGRQVGYGTHQDLLENCPLYRETFEIQMGELA